MKTVLAVAAIEFLGLLSYGISIAYSAITNGSSGATGSDVSPWVLTASYLLFAALVGAMLRALLRGSKAARTPFLLAQAFAIVVAEPLLSGGEAFERVLGWLLVGLAAVGAISILSRQGRQTLR